MNLRRPTRSCTALHGVPVFLRMMMPIMQFVGNLGYVMVALLGDSGYQEQD